MQCLALLRTSSLCPSRLCHQTSNWRTAEAWCHPHKGFWPPLTPPLTSAWRRLSPTRHSCFSSTPVCWPRTPPLRRPHPPAGLNTEATLSWETLPAPAWEDTSLLVLLMTLLHPGWWCQRRPGAKSSHFLLYRPPLLHLRRVSASYTVTPLLRTTSQHPNYPDCPPSDLVQASPF